MDGCRQLNAKVNFKALGRRTFRANSDPESAIQGAVLDGFANVVGGYGFAACEVGDGAGNFQDTIIGSRAKVEILHGVAEHFEGGVVDGTEFFDLTVRHSSIGGGFSFTGETLFLQLARLEDALENGG